MTVKGLYDAPMWEGFAEKRMLLQRCTACAHHRYPPAPVCPECLGNGAEWVEVSGSAKVLSWAIFHKKYLPEYPVPYNSIAVELAEGPTMVSNLEGDVPEGSLIGRDVELVWSTTGELGPLPRFKLK
ncbi:MAG: OB-fold domain-containing protein [Pseudomonadota bacterium]